MEKGYLKTFFYISISICFMSCVVKHQAVLGDAIRFSDDAECSYTHEDGVFKNLHRQSAPYMLYTQDGIQSNQLLKMKKFIRKNSRVNATAGYYALDLGLDRVKYVRQHYFKHDPNTKYYIIYMTDGLDNTSVQVAHNHGQIWFTMKEETYAKRIQRKMKNTMGALKLRQNTFKVFPIMFIGDDMKINMAKRGLKTEADIMKAAAEDMKYYRGSSRGTSTPEVLLGTNFEEITKNFGEMFASSGFEFYVPVGYNGQQVRMTLTNEKGEVIQIEGKLRKKWFSWCLTNIKYPHNVSIPDQRFLYRGKPIKELYASNRKDKKALSAFFRMEDIKLNGKNYKVIAAEQEHGKYYETNTEYEAFKKTNTNAYILLIMDVSTSLGDETENEKKAMEDILDIIMNTATE